MIYVFVLDDLEFERLSVFPVLPKMMQDSRPTDFVTAMSQLPAGHINSFQFLKPDRHWMSLVHTSAQLRAETAVPMRSYGVSSTLRVSGAESRILPISCIGRKNGVHEVVLSDSMLCSTIWSTDS
jgi:hypothetical protein